MVPQKTVTQVKEALQNAAQDIRNHIVNPPKDGNYPAVTANLCEAYLDEWYTLGILAKSGGKG